MVKNSGAFALIGLCHVWRLHRCPKDSVKTHDSDELIIYDKLPILRTLDSRRAGVHGDHDHELVVEEKKGAE